MKIIGGTLLALILFTTSMFSRIIYDHERFVDCHIGKYTVTLKANDCKQNIEYLIWHQKTK